MTIESGICLLYQTNMELVGGRYLYSVSISGVELIIGKSLRTAGNWGQCVGCNNLKYSRAF
jgi:hypothetical protein